MEGKETELDREEQKTPESAMETSESEDESESLSDLDKYDIKRVGQPIICSWVGAGQVIISSAI